MPQAIVSNGVGFGASVAADAAIGTLIPAPVVGTVLGTGLPIKDLGADLGDGAKDLTKGAFDAIF